MNLTKLRKNYRKLFLESVFKTFIFATNPRLYMDKSIFEKGFPNRHPWLAINDNRDIGESIDILRKMSSLHRKLKECKDTGFLLNPFENADEYLYFEKLKNDYFEGLRGHATYSHYNYYNSNEEFKNKVMKLSFMAYKLAFIDQSFQCFCKNRQLLLINPKEAYPWI